MVFQGRDTLIEAALAYGAAGSVPGTANIFPQMAVAIYEAHRRGDHVAARAAQTKVQPAAGWCWRSARPPARSRRQ